MIDIYKLENVFEWGFESQFGEHPSLFASLECDFDDDSINLSELAQGSGIVAARKYAKQLTKKQNRLFREITDETTALEYKSAVLEYSRYERYGF